MKIKIVISFLITIFIGISSFPQDSFTVEIEPLILDNAPNVHSFSWGKTNDGKWIILGGRIDGLHQRQPFAAFLENDDYKDVQLGLLNDKF